MASSSVIDISTTEIERGVVSEFEWLKLTFKMSELNLSDDEDFLLVNKMNQLNLLSNESLAPVSLAVNNQVDYKRKRSEGKESKPKKVKVDEIGNGEVLKFNWLQLSFNMNRLDDEHSRIGLLGNQTSQLNLLSNKDLEPIVNLELAVENRGESQRKRSDEKESNAKKSKVCIEKTKQQVEQKNPAEIVLKSTSRNMGKTKKEILPNRLAPRTNISGRGEKFNELREILTRRKFTEEKLRNLKKLEEIVTRRKENEKALEKLKEKLNSQNTKGLNLEPKNKSPSNSYVNDKCSKSSKKNEGSMNEEKRIGKSWIEVRTQKESSNAKRHSITY